MPNRSLIWYAIALYRQLPLPGIFVMVSTVKSDRINALRKQYDAFLEEDKRRKERNEYILGRLDKMRYCTAVVPLRHKPTIFIDRRDNFSSSSSLSQLNKSSLDVPKQFDETIFLQEITKKYILIPKIRPSNEAANISIPTLKPTFEENGDWKSKYEILEQLKKGEKEPDASVFCPEFSEQNTYDNLQEPDVQKYYDHNIDQSKLSYKYELPEKDKDDKHCTEAQKNFEAFAEHSTNALSNNQVDQSLIEEPLINTNTVDSLPQNNFEFNNNREQLETHSYLENQTKCTPTLNPEPASIDENIEHNIPPNYSSGNDDERDTPATVNTQYTPVEEDKDTGDTEKYYPEDMQSVEVIHPDDLVKQINDTVKPIAASASTENYQYPIQTVDVQDFTPDSQAVLQDGGNINPEGYPAELSNAYALENSNPTYEYDCSSEVISHIENTTDTSGIEAFDAEQREMFYSEGTNENYGYNQDNMVEVYDQELPVQGADYSQAEAVYYEGYDAEQVYPVDTGEHEDTNQRYDPHYEQQYTTNYSSQEYSQEGYDQQVHAQNPNSEGDMNKVQEGLEQFQFEEQHEYETVQNIEQQLDAEQGFNEQIMMNNIEKPIEDLQAKAPKPASP
ncbi:uncharacterized protein LOC128677083 isoform X2 [Plodia interpunctella]|uniref:uncharacterized protein LOC128677083 isoform X2 n=1 Tax=Plodia interpunctella TaxID=58824 RepID=UPI0023678C3E|nr:uncharacterized protein LOC128677083 isoform X2 [Plodia interpunctella]